MRTLSVAAFVLVLPLVGCGRPGPDETEEIASHGAETPDRHGEGAPSSILQIDREMLRDLRVSTATVEERPGGEAVTILGELRVNEEAYAEVGAPVAARVVKILAAPGDRVEAGQALTRLQSPDLGKARAELLSATARADLSARALERKRGLFSQRVIAQRELQEAEAAAQSARAELQAAEAALHALGVRLEDASGEADPSVFVLRSPIRGVVIDREMALGQLAEPARPLFKIGDLSRLWLIVHAFERDAVRVRAGAASRVAFPALPGRVFSGRVAHVGGRVDTGSRTIPVRIELENPDGILRPGMSASAEVTIGGESGTILAVPAAATQRIGDRWCVFIPREAGIFEIRAVGRGRDLGGEVEILSGLGPGEVVVVEGAFLLKAEVERSGGDSDGHDH